MSVYYPNSVLLALFANIIQHPEGPNVDADLDLMQVILDFLGNTMKNECLATVRMQAISEQLYRTAREHVETTRAKTLHKVKRSREQFEEVAGLDTDGSEGTEKDLQTNYPAPEEISSNVCPTMS